MSDPTGPTDVEDVEVIGERIRRYVDPAVGIGVVVYSIWTGSGYVEFTPLNPDFLDSLFDGTTEIVENPTQPTVRINTAVPRTHPQYPLLVEKSLQLAVRVNQVDGLVRMVDNQENLFLPQNNQMGAIEFKNLWFKMSYVVTLENYGNGRGGEVLIDPVTGNATAFVNANTLDGYINDGGEEFALNYYVIHEWAHTSPESIGFHQSQYNLYQIRMAQEGTPDPRGVDFYGSTEGRYAETFTNAVTQIFGNLPGASLWQNPPNG